MAEDIPTWTTRKFHHLLNSNTCPGEEELSTIQSALREPLRELGDIELEIARLQACLAKANHRRKDIISTTQPLRTILSPVRRLPDDILQEIFLRCLPNGCYPAVDNQEAPLLFMRVSRRWRFTAINTRRLWIGVRIALPSLQHTLSGHYLNHPGTNSGNVTHRFRVAATSYIKTVSDWLGRIGGYQVSFSIYQKDDRNSDEDQLCESVLRVLMGHSRVWHRAEIRIPLRSMGELIKASSDVFPKLTDLVVSCTSRSKALGPATFDLFNTPPGGPDVPPLAQSGIFQALRLSSLKLMRVDEPLYSFDVNWSFLTSLVIEEQGTFSDFGSLRRTIALDIPTLVTLLRQCFSLETARVSLTPGIAPLLANHEALSEPLILPLLHTLAFHEDRSCSTAFFDCLEAPALKTLEFQTLRKPEDPTSTTYSILPFLRRHGSILEELVVDTRYISHGDRAELWGCLGGLRVLRLRKSTFRSVVYGGEEQGLLPFCDQDLESLIPDPPSPSFSSSSSMVSLASLSSSRSGSESLVSLVGGGSTTGSSSLPSSRSLLPQLEAFECKTLSMLSDDVVLRFMEARCSTFTRPSPLSSTDSFLSTFSTPVSQPSFPWACSSTSACGVRLLKEAALTCTTTREGRGYVVEEVERLSGGGNLEVDFKYELRQRFVD
ncbi:hypothetical protein FA15DRAFT_671336 [Coprinopsis marcescibilis]|uniref:F-box domain-containing protein n=1 Tax=Coprinopsis marcescibilis TaxID=230819 RepID=A0A5C3KR48_COPMA|nr:hypothetical protein FA15DRAFT_671336 [Coprinopsis marcescibilis]